MTISGLQGFGSTQNSEKPSFLVKCTVYCMLFLLVLVATYGTPALSKPELSTYGYIWNKGYIRSRSQKSRSRQKSLLSSIVIPCWSLFCVSFFDHVTSSWSHPFFGIFRLMDHHIVADAWIMDPMWCVTLWPSGNLSCIAIENMARKKVIDLLKVVIWSQFANCGSWPEWKSPPIVPLNHPKNPH